jgi:hypothetical protein
MSTYETEIRASQAHKQNKTPRARGELKIYKYVTPHFLLMFAYEGVPTP